MLPKVRLDSRPINAMTAKSITGRRRGLPKQSCDLQCWYSHTHRQLSDVAYLQFLADSSEHTVSQKTTHDNRQRKEVGLAQRYRLSILLSPTHRAVCPGTRLSRIPAIQIDEPCKYSADQSRSSVYNTSGASQLFGVSFSPSEKIVDTAFWCAPYPPNAGASFSGCCLCHQDPALL